MKKWRLLVWLLSMLLIFGGCGGTDGSEQIIWEDTTYPDGSPELVVETTPDGGLKRQTYYDEGGNVDSITEFYTDNAEVKKRTQYQDGNIVYESGFDRRGEEIYNVCYEYENGMLYRQECWEEGKQIVTYFTRNGEISERLWLNAEGKTRRVELYVPGKAEPFVYEAVLVDTSIEIAHGYGSSIVDPRSIYEVNNLGEEFFVAHITPEGVLQYTFH